MFFINSPVCAHKGVKEDCGTDLTTRATYLIPKQRKWRLTRKQVDTLLY